MPLKPARSKKFLVLFIAVFLSLGANFTYAEPEVQIETQTYPLRGKSEQELGKLIHDQGLGTARGEQYSAYCRWNVQWFYKYHRGSDACSIASVSTKVRILYYLPKWANPMGADLVTRLKWDAFIKALTTHEEGHGQHGIQAAEEIEDTLAKMQLYKTCGELSAACEERAKSIVEKHRQEDVSYDEKTQHGRTQGVVFY